MTRAQVVTDIKHKTGLSIPHISLVMERFCDLVKQAVQNGDTVHMRGFGSFSSKRRAPKIARHIRSNTAIKIDAHYVPVFKPSAAFLHAVKHSKKLMEELRSYKSEES